MATYVNDLRLKEIATGDESGTWGTSTNTNLELIAEAFSFGTEGITTNADTHTTTIADGSTDPGRSLFLKYTGTLDSACTITIGPNTVSKLWFIENATSGSQNIIIKQGSGATVTIPAGDTKAIYSDGAGSGAAMVDAFASLNVVDLKVEDDLTVTDDLIVNGDIDLEGSIDVNGTANLDVVDIDGAVDMASTLQVDGAITSSSGATITVSDNSDTLSLVSTDADASNGPVLRLYRNSSSPADNDFLGNIQFVGRNDNSQDVQYAEEEVYILDASDGTEDGLYNINVITGGTNLSYLQLKAGTGSVFNEDSNDIDFRVESNGNANMLFVDGGNDRVGIGMVPSTDFHIKGITTFDGDGSSRAEITSSTASSIVSLNVGGFDGTPSVARDVRFFANTASGSKTERWRISSTGILTSGGNSGVGIGGTPADANFAEVGAGYINLARDDTADADQILFGKNGAIHSKITTSASGLTVGSIGNLNAFVNAGTSGSNILDLQSGGTTRVRVQNSGLEVNPSGLNSGDLIAQSDNNTHMLFVDASADAVGVGVSDPAGLPLHLKVSSGDNKLRQETAAKDAFTLGLDNSTGDTIIGTNTLYPHVRFLDGGGICFGSDTAAANALDDYEEGTWTPAFANGFDGNYTVQQGQYTKIGRQVIAALHLDINSASTGSTGNQIKISGLPFLPDVGTTYGGSTSIHGTSWATGRTSLNMLVFDNNTTAVLYYNMCASVGAAISPTYADIGSGNLLTVLVYNADT